MDKKQIISDINSIVNKNNKHIDLVNELVDYVDKLLDIKISNCPICGEEMDGIELTHYKCKKCNEYFTN